jgi:hypothetical protein
MKLETAKLAEAFKIVDNVPINPAIPSSQFLRLEASGGKLKVRLVGLLQAQVILPCEGDLDCSLDRRVLGPFLERAGEATTFALKDGSLTVKSGRANLSAALPENPESDIWKPGKGQKLQVPGAYMGLLTEYCAPLPGMDYLEVASCQKGYGMMATDSLASVLVADKGVVCDLQIPRQLAALMPKLQSEELWVERNGMALRFPNGWIYQPRPASEQQYPVPALQEMTTRALKAKPMFKAAPEALLEGLSHLGAFTWASEGVPVIQCVPTDKGMVQMRLEGATVQADWKVQIAPSAKLPEKWGWALARLLPWLKCVADPSLSENVANRMLEYGTITAPGDDSEGALQWFRAVDAEGRALLLVMVELGGR